MINTDFIQELLIKPTPDDLKIYKRMGLDSYTSPTGVRYPTADYFNPPKTSRINRDFVDSLAAGEHPEVQESKLPPMADPDQPLDFFADPVPPAGIPDIADPTGLTGDIKPPVREDAVRAIKQLKGLARGTENVIGTIGSMEQWVAERATIGNILTKHTDLPYGAGVVAEYLVRKFGPKKPMEFFDKQMTKYAKQGEKWADFWEEQSQKGWEAPDPEVTQAKWRDMPITKGVATISEAAPNYLAAIASSVLTKSPQTGLLFISALSGAGAYRRQRKAGAGVAKANAIATLTGAWEYITEKVPFDEVFKPAKSKFLKMLKLGTLESAQEFVQGIGENFLEYFGYKAKDLKSVPAAVKEGLEHTMDGWVENVVAGAGLGVMGGGIVPKGGLIKAPETPPTEAIPAPQQAVAEQKAEIPPVTPTVAKAEPAKVVGKAPIQKVEPPKKPKIKEIVEPKEEEVTDEELSGITKPERRKLIKETAAKIEQSDIYQTEVAGMDTMAREVGPGYYYINKGYRGEVEAIIGKRKGFPTKIQSMFTFNPNEKKVITLQSGQKAEVGPTPWESAVQEGLGRGKEGVEETWGEMDISEFVQRVVDSYQAQETIGGISKQALEQAEESGHPDIQMLAEKHRMLAEGFSDQQINEMISEWAEDWGIDTEDIEDEFVNEYGTRIRQIKKMEDPDAALEQLAAEQIELEDRQAAATAAREVLEANDIQAEVEQVEEIPERPTDLIGRPVLEGGAAGKQRGLGELGLEFTKPEVKDPDQLEFGDTIPFERRGRPVGAAITQGEKQVILLAYGADSETGYHEGYHILRRRLTEKNTRVLDKYFKGDEEAEATAFAEYVKTGKARTFLKGIWQKLRNLLRKVKSGLQGRGFKTAEDIFGAIRKGTVAQQAAREGVAFETRPIFYSKLERAVQNMPTKMGSQAFRNWANKQGIKKEEMIWSGVDELLTKTVTVNKQQVLDTIAANNIQIEEVKRGGEAAKIEGRDLHQINQELASYSSALSNLTDSAYKKLERAGVSQVRRVNLVPKLIGLWGEDVRQEALKKAKSLLPDFDWDRLVELGKERTKLEDERSKLMEAQRGTETIFERYTLPGGENYTELLLRMPPPELKALTVEERRRYEALQQAERIESLTPEQREELDKMRFTQSQEVYTSPHFKETNILAHIRFTDRWTKGEKRVLFIEEIQSDWHQVGRKAGYKGPGFKRLEQESIEANKRSGEHLKMMREKHGITASEAGGGATGFYNRKSGKIGSVPYSGSKTGYFVHATATPAQIRLMDKYAELRRLWWDIEEQTREAEAKVPDAPFKKTWHELALKRMLRYAAENGYNQLAWTTGEQQAERYDLSKQLKEVRYQRDDSTPPLYSLTGVLIDGRQHNFGEFYTENELTGAVGKELAEKIVNNPKIQDSYSGLDLKIGGEGMKAFYDRMVPNFLRKYAKKWGATIGTTRIETEKTPAAKMDDFGVFSEGRMEQLYEKVPSMPITSKMKESVMAGQVQFETSGEKARREVEKRARIKARAARIASQHKIKTKKVTKGPRFKIKIRDTTKLLGKEYQEFAQRFRRKEAPLKIPIKDVTPPLSPEMLTELEDMEVLTDEQITKAEMGEIPIEGEYKSQSDAFNEHLDYFQNRQLPKKSKIRVIQAQIRTVNGKRLAGKISAQKANNLIHQLRKQLFTTAREEGIAFRMTRGGKLSLSVRKAGTYVPEEFAQYGKFKNIRPILGGGQDITRAIQQMDGSLSVKGKLRVKGQAGPLERHVLWPTRDISLQKLKYIKEKTAELKSIFKTKKGSKEDEQVNLILEQIAKEDRGTPIKDILSRKTLRSIASSKVIQQAIQLREYYDNLIEEQNLAREMRNQDPIPYRHNYSPHILRDTTIWERLMMTGKKPKDIKADLPDYIKPNAPFNPRAMAREAGIEYEERVKSAQRLAESYLVTASKDIFNTSIVQNNKAFIRQLDAMGYDKSANYLADWTAEAYAGIKPRLDRAIQIGRKAEKGARYFNRLRNMAVFPLNFSWSLLTQTSSLALTVGRYGTTNTMRGFVQWLNPKIRKQAAENYYSYVVKAERQGKITRQDAQNLIGVNVKLRRTKTEIAHDISTLLLDQLEKLLTGTSIRAARLHGQKRGLTGEALKNYASDGGAKTQSMYNDEDKPALLRNILVKTGAPYQTFAYEVVNTMREWAGRTGTPPDTKLYTLWTMVRFLAAATVFAAIGKKWGNKEIWSWKRPPIPFAEFWLNPIVKMFSNQWIGSASGLTSPVETATRVARGIVDVLETGSWRKLRNELIKYGPGILGVPGGIQISRTVDAIIAYAQGGVKDRKGRLLFEMEDPQDLVQAIFSGVWSTEGGRAYLDIDYKIKNMTDKELKQLRRDNIYKETEVVKLKDGTKVKHYKNQPHEGREKLVKKTEKELDKRGIKY